MMRHAKVLLGGFLALACVVVSCAASWAGETGPRETLAAAVDSVLETLRDPGYADPATRAPLRRSIEARVETVFDFSEFSARTVGARWKGFSPEQQRRFDEAFARLLMTTYLDNVQGYNGEKVDYVGERRSPQGDRAEIATVVTLGDGKKVPVSYRMLLKSGRWVVYDVIIENVSLIKNYRAQFKEVLVKGDAEQLISRIVDRADALDKRKK